MEHKEPTAAQSHHELKNVINDLHYIGILFSYDPNPDNTDGKGQENISIYTDKY